MSFFIALFLLVDRTLSGFACVKSRYTDNYNGIAGIVQERDFRHDMYKINSYTERAPAIPQLDVLMYLYSSIKEE
ncbi:MAG: hypothetical protein Q4G47_02895, partial [Lachnospiraceae bacterium]|nr:hypothetical protein [Lachnospiraceae bacterium]